MKKFTKDFVDKCRKKLLELKTDNMNKLRNLQKELQTEVQPDVVDQAAALQAENITDAQRLRILQTNKEIDRALERIQEDSFGVCEETGDLIEEKRLLTIPWARLSREGAEIREDKTKQEKMFATGAGSDSFEE